MTENSAFADASPIPTANAAPTPGIETARWTPAQVCFGLFIVWQVAFVIGNGFLPLIQESVGNSSDETAELVDRLTLGLSKEQGPGQQVLQVLRRWGQVTGQEQSWCLFAPGVADRGRFLHVRLVWDDGRPPEVVPAEVEPPDLACYFRWGHSRLRKYESYVGMNFFLHDDETEQHAYRRWQERIRRAALNQADYLPVYLRARWRRYLGENPGCTPPTEIQLLVCCWDIPPPGQDPWFWRGPLTVPFARLLPSADANRGILQAYNPVTTQFDDLHKSP